MTSLGREDDYGATQDMKLPLNQGGHQFSNGYGSVGGNGDSPGPLAIDCRHLYKSYGSGKNTQHVLQDLRMQVPKGIIYGLLGPSGCGKTTLLRCCLGRLGFDKGIIMMLGKPPNTRGHGIPGRMVGYMPQETALYYQFTINETLNYFGMLHKLRGEALERRKEFLINLLILPDKNSLVGNLSGGQMRRVSFAAALLQEPELLILDEPTVGVDPLLREKIWEYLLQFAKGGKTTIILTTHYIEEARQADMVGLMRNGKLLSESSPQALMDAHQTPTLEEVFLKLCMADATYEEDDVLALSHSEGANVPFEAKEGEQTVLLNDEKMEKGDPQSSRTSSHPTDDEMFVKFEKPPFKFWDLFPVWLNIWALIYKDFIKMHRSPGLVFFQFLIPVIEITLFCVCIGNDPKNLKVAIVNEDQGFFNHNYSNDFLKHLSNKTIIQVPIANYTDAVAGVKAGDYWGVMQFEENYSQDLMARFIEGRKATNETLEGSVIYVRLDMSNAQVALSLQGEIMTAYQDFLDEALKNASLNPLLGQLPVDVSHPIYGSVDTDFTDFMAPGVVLSIVFFLAVGLSALTFVTERKEGLLDRSWVAGVSPVEVMLGHVITQCIIMFVQIFFVVLFMYEVFKVPLEGNLFLIVLMAALQGLCGMAYGLCISSVCDEEIAAIQVALGSFYPIMLLSGIIWPIQAIPFPLYYISLAMPQTYAAESLRAVSLRGWGIDHFEVYMGFVVTLGWNSVLLVLAAVALKLRR